MVILVFGGTGLIGQEFCAHALMNNHQPIVVSRFPERYNIPYQIIGYADAAKPPVQRMLSGEFAAVNLTGANIASKSWSDSRKKYLLESRIDILDRIELFLQQAPQEPDALLQSSAIGYYGNTGSKKIDENSAPGSGFLSELAQKWEERFQKVELEDTRKLIMRTGIVLSNNGGMLPKVLKPFKLFAGGVIGSGKQYVSWIHIQDQVRAMMHLIEDKYTHGVYNLTAPEPVTMKTFTKAVGKTLRRPAFFKVPSFVIKAMYGQMGKETILEGTRVYPKRLQDYEFEFIFTDVNLALKNLLIKQKKQK
ncbi:Epimerase family protein [Salinivirga cyanobacteriivorans]|uniref:Epimerase family protein n=1 Tax=Salinivirga cyanobacteriivorans TaxID=1307839 RepID=A0A0S2I3F9_9BACT|nr:TIGR01777 family oxidoreductase [Salinivirga cyanobacteriivorans]ALO16778.1 Epimerase family protein [Salinivirga cyanobacteriivorans]